MMDSVLCAFKFMILLAVWLFSILVLTTAVAISPSLLVGCDAWFSRALVCVVVFVGSFYVIYGMLSACARSLRLLRHCEAGLFELLFCWFWIAMAFLLIPSLGANIFRLVNGIAGDDAAWRAVLFALSFVAAWVGHRLFVLLLVRKCGTIDLLEG